MNEARHIQKERFQGRSIHCNAQMNTRLIRKFCTIDEQSHQLLEAAVNQLGASARAYSRVLKIARTIADLEKEPSIKPEHISEAIQYRSLDRRKL